MEPDGELTPQQRGELLEALQARFEKNMRRHPGLVWTAVRARLDAHPDKLRMLYGMEQSGGEPDVVGHDEASGELLFVDCSAQSPAGRRKTCYDRAAQDARKTAKPENNALDMAATLGIEILTEEQYRALQELDEFDTTTSSWVKMPAAIRKLGSALFADRRYNAVFVYHNGAQSYYAARGFRGALRV